MFGPEALIREARSSSLRSQLLPIHFLLQYSKSRAVLADPRFQEHENTLVTYERLGSARPLPHLSGWLHVRLESDEAPTRFLVPGIFHILTQAKCNPQSQCSLGRLRRKNTSRNAQQLRRL